MKIEMLMLKMKDTSF